MTAMLLSGDGRRLLAAVRSWQRLAASLHLVSWNMLEWCGGGDSRRRGVLDSVLTIQRPSKRDGDLILTPSSVSHPFQLCPKLNPTF